MLIGKLELANDEKYSRAINGAVSQRGEMRGGVGEDAPDEVKIAQYDKLGGLILKNGRKVKMGCFFDFKKNKAIENPVIIIQFRDLNGNLVEIEDGEAIPLEVQAAEIQQGKTASKAKKVKKVKKSIEDEE